MAYRITAIVMIFSDLQGPSPLARFLNVIFRAAVQHLTRF